MLSVFLNELLKKQDKGMDAVEKNFEDWEVREKKRLEREVTNAEAKINQSLKLIEQLKKDLKISDFQKDKKTNELKENENLVNELKNKIKENSKTLSKLSGSAKNQINEFRGKLKEFYKLTTGFLKIIDSKLDLEKFLKISDDHLNYVSYINDKMSLANFIINGKLDFKLKGPTRDIRITDYNQYVAVYLETIMYHILEAHDEEKINKEKQKLAELVLSYAKAAVKYSEKASNMDSDYYKELERFCESDFVIAIAHKEFKEFNLTKATGYFIDARDKLKSIKGLGKSFQSLISERMKVSEAWASDAYNLIYLFNSYSRWKDVSDSENSEIKEIAQITKEKVEDFVTSQFGFPEDDKLKQIISRELRWPAGSSPPEVSKIGSKL